jgi:hypothetical protein
MNFTSRSLHIAALTILTAGIANAQMTGMAGHPMDETVHAVADGGIKVPGWMGKTDGTGDKPGETVNDSRFAKDGAAFHVTTGPAITYWNPANKVSGDYTVSATFTEPKFMNLNSHPHPYGIVIAGNNMGTATQSYIYCAAYGNGRFIVRGFGPASFQVNGRGEANGYRDVGQGRFDHLLGQWHSGGDISEVVAGDGRKADLDRWSLWHPICAQYRRVGDEPEGDQAVGFAGL